MNILVLDQFSELGGGQQCLRDVLCEIRNRGWQASVLAPGKGPLLDFARQCGFAAASLPLGAYTSGRKTIRDVLRFSLAIQRCAQKVRNAVRERRPDLIYVNGPRVLPAIIFERTPLIFHAHSVLEQRYATLLAAALLRRRSARVIACSEFAARPLRKRLGRECVRVLYNGVPDHGFRPRADRASPVTVGILGRIAPEKGHLDFVKAAYHLSDRPDLVFRVIGSSLFSNASYETSVRAAAGAARVEFEGWTDDVAGALHALDILAVPSAAQDASPRVILDAFAAGTCVVAYPSGGIPELVRHDDNGLLTTRRSPDAMAEMIRLLAGRPDRRKQLAANGRRDWESRFQAHRFKAEVCDIMAETTGPKGLGTSGFRSRSGAPESACDAGIAAP